MQRGSTAFKGLLRLPPGPHPEPPADLAARALPFLRTFGPWFRIYPARHPPVHFAATGDNRFDAPGREFGTLYVGGDPHCAFIETFGHNTGVRSIATGALERRLLCRIETARELALVDLRGAGLARLGADERLCSGDIGASQRWALALWAHPQAPDGICYRARHDPSRTAAAIFERAQSTVHAVIMGGLLEYRHTALLADILDTYHFSLAP